MTDQIDQLLTLLVEPSPSQHKVIEHFLKDIGVKTVLWEQNGKAAISTLQLKKPDLIISSMHLPDMTGTDLVLKIRTGDVIRDVPYILISSETHYRYLEPIRQAGVIATLPKPFERDQLEKALYATLDYFDMDPLDIKGGVLEECKVLLVDDSEFSRRHIKNILLSMGIEDIAEVDNGREALECVNQNYYDLIVTDFHMPEMDGKELIEHIRQESDQASVPILMVSSESEESRLAAVKNAGVSAICDKPFEPTQIKKLIEKILD